MNKNEVITNPDEDDGSYELQPKQYSEWKPADWSKAKQESSEQISPAPFNNFLFGTCEGSRVSLALEMMKDFKNTIRGTNMMVSVRIWALETKWSKNIRGCFYAPMFLWIIYLHIYWNNWQLIWWLNNWI